MKASKIREQTDEELQLLYADIKRQICDIRIKQGVADGADSPVKIKGLKRDLARINTVINENAAKAKS